MKLQPCPKCGGEPVVHISWDEEYVQCRSCGAKTETVYGDYYDEGAMDGMDAAALWNSGKIYVIDHKKDGKSK